MIIGQIGVSQVSRYPFQRPAAASANFVPRLPATGFLVPGLNPLATVMEQPRAQLPYSPPLNPRMRPGIHAMAGMLGGFVNPATINPNASNVRTGVATAADLIRSLMPSGTAQASAVYARRRF